jgi:hypothetical protein
VTHKRVACFSLIESEDYKEYKPPSLENGYLRLGGDRRLLRPENVKTTSCTFLVGLSISIRWAITTIQRVTTTNILRFVMQRNYSEGRCVFDDLNSPSDPNSRMASQKSSFHIFTLAPLSKMQPGCLASGLQPSRNGVGRWESSVGRIDR